MSKVNLIVSLLLHCVNKYQLKLYELQEMNSHSFVSIVSYYDQLLQNTILNTLSKRSTMNNNMNFYFKS